jgi:hypothetical protein
VSLPPPEVSKEALDGIRQANQQRLVTFQAQGVNVQIPPAPSPMVELLIEAVAGPQGSSEWLAFMHAYEERIAAMLDQVESQVARAKLMAPGAPPNGGPARLPKDLGL